MKTMLGLWKRRCSLVEAAAGFQAILMGRAALGSVLLGVFVASGKAHAADLSFTRDIAPIVFNQCTQCHRPGEAGGLSFKTYDEVKSAAKLIAKVTQSRFMPPWKVEPGHGDFVNERGLSEAQIQLFQDWLAQGMPEGDPAALPALPQFTEGWQLGQPDVVITMPETYTVPASGPDLYVNFVVPIPDLPEGKYVRAIEYRTTARSVAHHTLFALDSKGLGRELDADEPGPGFSGMAAALRKSRIGGWAVGAVPAPYPDYAAIPVPKGSDMIFEAHFHPNGKEAVEQASLGLFLTDRAPTHQMIGVPVPFQFGVGLNLRIPAGEKHYEARDSFTLPIECDVINIFPHAHYLCKEMHATATLPDGTEKELILIKDWDFAWQEQYTYREPVRLPAGTVLNAYFVFDNSAENPRNPTSPPKEVCWGPESTDEMASLAISAIPVNNDEAKQLRAAIEAYRIASLEKVDMELLRKTAMPMIMARLDTNKDGAISFSERIAGMQKARRRMGDDSGMSMSLISKFAKGLMGF